MTGEVGADGDVLQVGVVGDNTGVEHGNRHPGALGFLPHLGRTDHVQAPLFKTQVGNVGCCRCGGQADSERRAESQRGGSPTPCRAHRGFNLPRSR